MNLLNSSNGSASFVEPVLVVDDDCDHLAATVRFISSFGYAYKAVNNGREAMEAIKDDNYSVIVTDIEMPDVDGMQLLKFVKESYPQTDVIVMTGHTRRYSYIDVIREGATDFIVKPFFDFRRSESCDQSRWNRLHLPGADVPLHAHEASNTGMHDGQPKRL